MPAPRVGTFATAARFERGLDSRKALVRAASEAGVDHVCVGDHVSFFVGAGDDGVVEATSLLSLHETLPVYVALYLLPLRHPVPVARQLATVAEVAPGRLTFGVGIGGEDRHEIEICGVDPSTRGRRMDEYVTVLRQLLTGQPVSFDGEFVDVEDALIVPAPASPIPLVVGGRSEAAVTRAARLGDGWLGIWVSAQRFAKVSSQIADAAGAAGRGEATFEHGLNVWCGFGDTAEEARGHVADGMQSFYQIPYESFERYSPFGTPADVAEFLGPYVEAGCSAFNVIPCAADPEAAVAAVGEVRNLLAGRT